MLFDVRLIQEAFERLISWEISAVFSNIEMRAVVRFLTLSPFCSFFLVIILLCTLTWGMDVESPVFLTGWKEVYPWEHCRLLSSGPLTGIFCQGWGCKQFCNIHKPFHVCRVDVFFGRNWIYNGETNGGQDLIRYPLGVNWFIKKYFVIHKPWTSNLIC